MECSLLEIQKLVWFLERAIERAGLPSLDLRFKIHRYGPSADRLCYLREGLDESYLHCDKRISDAEPIDVIWFDDSRKDFVQRYLKTEAKEYAPALEETAAVIDGFESPFGMWLLATVDWLLTQEHVEPTVPALRDGLRHWHGSGNSAARKNRTFDDRVLTVALNRITAHTRTIM